MLKTLGNLFSGSRPIDGASASVPQPEPAQAIEAPQSAPLDFAACLVITHGLPVPDWHRVNQWVARIPEEAAQARAWADAELAWLAHLLKALGPSYRLVAHEGALLLSPLEPRAAEVTVQYMTRTLARIGKVLEGIARTPEWGSDILLVFEDEDTYYRYVSRYYPEDGEFAFSSGMHVNFGCSHFATFQAELRAMEPVIAHEMTHACLGHLSIPAWLNEGLAVNTERRLCPPPSQEYTPQQLHRMHRQFWSEERIQEFWSGKSFLRPDEGNLLSYELARILTEQLSADWPSFRTFVNSAQLEDAGSHAAQETLGVDLGSAVAALFDLPPSDRWAPNPSLWQGTPERGAFRGSG